MASKSANEVTASKPKGKKEKKEEELRNEAFKGDAKRLHKLLKSSTSFDINAIDVNGSGYSAFHLAAVGGHLDAINELIAAKANVDVQSNDKSTPLYLACLAGHTEIVKALLAAKASTEITHKDSSTPLFVAASSGFIDVVNTLIAGGAKLDSPDAKGVTPIAIACENGHSGVIMSLFRAKANADLQDENGDSAIHRLCRKGFDDVLEELVGGVNLEIVNKAGIAPIHLAAQNGNVETLKILLKNGKVDYATPNGETALWFASAFGHVDALRVLVDAKADIRLQNKEGLTALHIAAREGRDLVVKILLDSIPIEDPVIDAKDKDGNTALILACQNNRPECAKLLIASKANVDAKNSSDVSALAVSSAGGYFEIVRLLLDANATIEVKMTTGATPLWLACQEGRTVVAKTLIDVEANVNQTDNEGRTPLWIASLEGHTETIRQLIKSGAKVDKCDASGSSPLWVAAQNGFADVCQVLIEAGADIETKDQIEELSPLGIAAYSGKLEVVNVLLEAKASTESPDKTGATPIWLAAQQGHGHVVDALIKGKAKVDATSDAVGGITPLFIAAHAGHVDTVVSLLEAGADPHLATVKGGTPLITAARSGHTLIACHLLFHDVKDDPVEPVNAKTIQNCTWILDNVKDEALLSNVQLQVIAAELRLRAFVQRQDQVGILRDSARLIQLLPKLQRQSVKSELSKLYALRARTNFGFEKWAAAAEDAFFAIQNDASIDRPTLLQDYLILVQSYVRLNAAQEARTHATDALRLASNPAERDYLMAVLDKAYLESANLPSHNAVIPDSEDATTPRSGLPVLSIDISTHPSMVTRLGTTILNGLNQAYQQSKRPIEQVLPTTPRATGSGTSAQSISSPPTSPSSTSSVSSMGLTDAVKQPLPILSVTIPQPQPNPPSNPVTPTKSPGSEPISLNSSSDTIGSTTSSGHIRQTSGGSGASRATVSDSILGKSDQRHLAASAPNLSTTAIASAKEKDSATNKKGKLSYFFSAFRFNKPGKEKEAKEKEKDAATSKDKDKSSSSSDKVTKDAKSKSKGITLQLPTQEPTEASASESGLTASESQLSPRSETGDQAIGVFLDYYIDSDLENEDDTEGGDGGDAAGEFDPAPQMPDDDDTVASSGQKASPRRGQSFRGAPAYADLLRQVDTLKRRVQTAEAQVKDAESRSAAQAKHFDVKLKELTQRLIETEVQKQEFEARLRILSADPDKLTSHAPGEPTLTETATQNVDLKRQVAELTMKLSALQPKDELGSKQNASSLSSMSSPSLSMGQQQASTTAGSHEVAALKKQVGDLERRLKHNADHFNQQLQVFIGINTQYEKENAELRRQLAAAKSAANPPAQ